MSDLSKALEGRISPADWELMAKHANVGVDELKTRVLEAFENEAAGKSPAVPAMPVVSQLALNGECQSQKFEISLWKIIGVTGTLTLCGDSSESWYADLQLCLLVAGAEVWCTSYRFDPHNLGVCFAPDVVVAKANLCVKLEKGDQTICFNLNGSASIWLLFVGWQSGNFDVTPFCIPRP